METGTGNLTVLVAGVVFASVRTGNVTKLAITMTAALASLVWAGNK